MALSRASLVYGEGVEPAQCLAVGDTLHDAEGAHAAGIKCVGVGSNKFDVEQLRAGGADYVLTSLTQGLPLSVPT
jgi:phosphoglycolate phosphatase